MVASSFRRQRGLSVLIVALLVAALAMAIAIGVMESRKSARRQAQRLEQQAEEAKKNAEERRARAEREALERAQQAAARPADPLVASLGAVDALMARWDDAAQVAGSTARVSLSGPVAQLQAIRRETQALVVPPCLERGKAEMIKGMEAKIDGVLGFMSGSGATAELYAAQKDTEALEAFVRYRADRSTCPSGG